MLDVIQSFVGQNHKKWIHQATYSKGLYPATLGNAHILHLSKTGNFVPGNHPNFLALELPKRIVGANAEEILKKIIAPLRHQRDGYAQLVKGTFFHGHEVFKNL